MVFVHKKHWFKGLTRQYVAGGLPHVLVAVIVFLTCLAAFTGPGTQTPAAEHSPDTSSVKNAATSEHMIATICVLEVMLRPISKQFGRARYFTNDAFQTNSIYVNQMAAIEHKH